MFETRAIAHEGDKLDLDPFAFWPDIKSRLVGFGGEQSGGNPDYVFHTLYTNCGTGPIVFTVQFTGLAAPRGTLILRVNELPEIAGANARQVAMSQMQLKDLIRADGRVTLAAEARAGSNSALLGYIYGDTVVTAGALTIEVERRAPDPHDPNQPTRFAAAADRVHTAPRLIEAKPGSLNAPASQLCTRNQLAEPVFTTWNQWLLLPRGMDAVDAWEQVYIARVLARYDAAQAGARGLGIGAADAPPVLKMISEVGCTVELTWPCEPMPDAPLLPGFNRRLLDPAQVGDLTGFDFVFVPRRGTIGSHDHQIALGFVEDVLRTLKPRGLAVIVFPFDAAPRAIGDEHGPMLRQADIARIGLLLVSRGHQVAHLCPFGDPVGAPDETGTLLVSAFGLVIRKAA